MAGSFNKSSRSRKISGPGPNAGAGQMPHVGPGKTGMSRPSMDANTVHGPMGSGKGSPRAGMGAGMSKGGKGYC